VTAFLSLFRFWNPNTEFGLIVENLRYQISVFDFFKWAKAIFYH